MQGQPRWSSPPDDMIGGVVSEQFVLTKNDWFAVVVSRILAFPTGFTMNLVALARPGTQLPEAGTRLRREDITSNLQKVRPRRGLPFESEDGFTLSLGFSDGSRAAAGWGGTGQSIFDAYSRDALAAMERPPHAFIESTGGGFTPTRHERTYWVAPLPPPGPLRFIFRWRVATLPETESTIDAETVLAAARRANTIWDS